MSLRSFIVAVAVMTSLVVAAAPARAGTLTWSDTDANGYNGNPGGEFAIKDFTGTFIPPSTDVCGSGEFRTFCLEKDEYITYGKLYTYTLSDTAQLGGKNTDSGDPLSVATAKLFYTFWTNQWSVSGDADLLGSSNVLTYDYANSASLSQTRAQDAADLQNAIWFLENELGSDLSTSGTAYGNLTTKAKRMVDFARDAQLTWSDLGVSWDDATIGGVRVINPMDGTTHKQSAMVVVPLPVGAWMGLALLGALGIGRTVRSRRRRDLV